MKDQHISRARAHCSLCDINFVASATHEISVEAELKSIDQLKEQLEEHFITSMHQKNVEAFKQYNEEIVGYING